MQRLRALVITALFTATSFSAWAGVVYRWEDVVPSQNFGAATGLLEIDDAYWQAGATVSLASSSTLVAPGEPYFSAFGVQNFFFVGAGYDGTGTGSTPLNLTFGPLGNLRHCCRAQSYQSD